MCEVLEASDYFLISAYEGKWSVPFIIV